MINHYFDRIELVIGKDAGNRGLGNIQRKNDLRGGVEALLEAENVFILTGFCIKDTMTGETDGPMGAASLANGLLQLGKKVTLVTDSYSEKLLEACCQALGIVTELVIVPYVGAEDYCIELIHKGMPDMVVAIERPGRGKDGKCYSMRGEDLSEFIPNTDPLLYEATKLNIKTLAIGDGGNEVGMGKIAEHIRNHVKLGEKICAVTSTDYLITTGVSNWGGHGVVAGLSVLTSQPLLHEVQQELEMLKGMIAVGGVDGCSKKSTLSVDGLSLEENLEILQELINIAEEAIYREPQLA